MVPPIDLLEVASRRCYMADNLLRIAWQLQESPDAELFLREARLAVCQAEADMYKIYRLAEELAEIQNDG